MGKRTKEVEKEESEEEKEPEEESGSDESEEEEEAPAESPKKKPKTEADAGGSRKLFVGGLSWHTEEDGLKDFFKDCGEVEEVFLPTDRDSGYKRGFGFVTFTDAAGAAEGEKLNNGELDGRWLNIRLAEEKPKRDDSGAGGEPQLKIFVGNLSFETSEETVTEFFKECGETTDVFFPTDRETGNYRGFCFITFAELEGSAAAVAMNGNELEGKELKINYSQPKTDKGGKGGGKGKGGKGGKGKGGKGGGKGGKGKGWSSW